MVFSIVEVTREENGNFKSEVIAYQKDISFLKGFFEALSGLRFPENKVLVLDGVYDRRDLDMESELCFTLRCRDE
jgi:hypothetical protein